MYQLSAYPNEAHAIIHVARSQKSLSQFEELKNSMSAMLADPKLKGMTAVFARIFLSDAANQTRLVRQLAERCDALRDCAVSAVQQPPLDGSKVAAWVYLMRNVEKCDLGNGHFGYKVGEYTHYFSCDANTLQTDREIPTDSETQTYIQLKGYADWLRDNGMALKDNCVRTWFFVNDIDNHYRGMVRGRNRLFAEEGLTECDHYIASTGIAGRTADPRTKTIMDAYAVGGLKPGQMGYLHARTHMNATHEYGVAFERGAYIDFADRRNIYVSGTASIDSNGRVLHPGDISRQTERMWENVEVLLKEAGCSFGDVGHLIVYLRDTADYAIVRDMFAERFPDKPTAILLAPVCRPEWLIEMECMAVK